MQYFSIDNMSLGETAVLLVTAQTPYREQWAERTPVTVTRGAQGWTYESRYGATVADMTVQPNPGHQGLNAHMRELTGAPYPFESLRESDLIRREYRILRRRAVTRPQYGWPYLNARDSLAKARATVQANRPSVAPYASGAQVWAGLGGSDGATFQAYGESACRWIEDPESKGLRLLGLAHEVGKAGYCYSSDAVEHRGWFMDSDGCETVCGVVYQLPGKDGRARYLAGYADPYNAESNGNGPALLSMEIYTGEPVDSEYDPDSVLRDVARAADGIAERMAESEREYQEGFDLGKQARRKMDKARKVGRKAKRARRDVGPLFKARHGVSPAPAPTMRDLCRDSIRKARRLRRKYERKRAAALAYRESNEPGRYMESALSGFNDGYAEGGE
jgi:hypothetical protein